MEPFDTVDDVRDWLSEEPSDDRVEAAIEVEKESEKRVTALRALRNYLGRDETEEATTTVEAASDGVEFRVERAFADHEVGEIIELDPDDDQTEIWRRDGRISLW